MDPLQPSSENPNVPIPENLSDADAGFTSPPPPESGFADDAGGLPPNSADPGIGGDPDIEPDGPTHPSLSLDEAAVKAHDAWEANRSEDEREEEAL